MKVVIFIICMLISIGSIAQEKTDTIKDKRDKIIIRDSWQKTDTSRNSLQNNTDLRILDNGTELFTEPNVMPEENNQHERSFELMILSRNVFKRSRFVDIDRMNRRFSGHWCGFNFGFVNFGNTDYSMYTEGQGDFMDLNYSGSFVMQFNVFEQSINLSRHNNFGFVVGMGLEYYRLKFENKYSSIIETKTGKIEPLELTDLDVKRNSFKTLYLTIPLMFEYQFPAKSEKNLYIAAGVVGGLRMHSKTKVVYKNDSGHKRKKKNSDNFNMIPVKADLTARIGYRSINVWYSYTLTNMFKSGKGPELHPYSVGFGISF